MAVFNGKKATLEEMNELILSDNNKLTVENRRLDQQHHELQVQLFNLTEKKDELESELEKVNIELKAIQESRQDLQSKLEYYKSQNDINLGRLEAISKLTEV